MTSEPAGELTADELQLAFHEVECATYDERFGIVYDARAAQQVAREARRLLGDRSYPTVLDVGAGTGYLGLGLKRAGYAGEVHLADLSPGMLRRAHENAAALGVEAHLVRATAATLPYADATFDAVVTRGVLHHLHDPVTALEEWRRVLRPGGRVVVLSEPTPWADRVGGVTARGTFAGLGAARRVAGRLGRPLSRHAPEAAETQRFWDLVAMAANLHTFTASELRHLGRAAGFTDVRVRASGLASIAWLGVYYCLAGELPGLLASDRARRRAGRVFDALRRLDAAALERIVPGRVLLTVQGVFS